jgi:hypothetical protein
VNRPSLASILIGLVPFVAICLSVPLFDRIHPIVFGLPFNLFWIIAWMLVTPVLMWRAYRRESRRESGADRSPEKRGAP